MKEQPCKTPFDEVRQFLAPPEPQSVGIKMVLTATSKLIQHLHEEFQERMDTLIPECEQRYRDRMISIADDIYSRIPEHKRT